MSINSHFVYSHLFNIYHMKCEEPNMDSVVSSPTSCEDVPQPVLIFCFDEVHFTLFICEHMVCVNYLMRRFPNHAV